MVESQLDRIENMIKVILQATTTTVLTGDLEDSETTVTQVQTYTKTPEPAV